MKKDISIKLVGFWDDMDLNRNVFFPLLFKNYNVHIVEDDPEYIICGTFGLPYGYCSFPQVRIMISGENYIPDFNLIDYSICSYQVDFHDRNFYLPEFLLELDYDAVREASEERSRFSLEDLKKKCYFANFITSFDSEYNIRGDFFKKLSNYKRVESCGKYLNNMPGNMMVKRLNGEKKAFQQKCKFTLCFESTKSNDFVTEKIMDAFLAGTIPVYHGSSNVTSIFNEKAFIYCPDVASFEETMRRIIELDNDDDQYVEMLRQPIFAENDYLDRKLKDFEQYIRHIFDQPLSEAFRRSRIACPKHHNDFLVRNNSILKGASSITSLSSMELLRALLKRTHRKINKLFH